MINKICVAVLAVAWAFSMAACSRGGRSPNYNQEVVVKNPGPPGSGNLPDKRFGPNGQRFDAQPEPKR